MKVSTFIVGGLSLYALTVFTLVAIAVVTKVRADEGTPSSPPVPPTAIVHVFASPVTVPGEWISEAGQWKWVGPHVETPPNANVVWVPGHWLQGPSGWLWLNGSWTARGQLVVQVPATYTQEPPAIYYESDPSVQIDLGFGVPFWCWGIHGWGFYGHGPFGHFYGHEIRHNGRVYRHR